jgi:alpha-amylase/alpha-mannosidase (GH57 family)
MERIMKLQLWRLFLVLMALILIPAACDQKTETPTLVPTTETPTLVPTTEIPTLVPTEDIQPTPTMPPDEDPIYLSIIWHQHQPVYFKDPETGVYEKPWVRVHATKDYVDMAAILKDYPDIRATFNLTPSLIRQLDDLEAGAKDLYWITAEVPSDQLTSEQKQFLLDRFFDTNRKVIARFPRYQELLEMRDNEEEFTSQDYLDLQVLFNLAWVDPDWLSGEPLAGLVAKGSNFSEEDKNILFTEHEQLIAQVIPVHKELQDTGQIEVTMTPFAHPILPLLFNTDLALVALPNLELPSLGFKYVQDAAAQINSGVQLYEDHFDQAPRGMWPAEGSVAQEIVTMVSNAGIQWIASDEGVLANSLGMSSFTRDAKEVVTESDILYRPYFVQGDDGAPVGIVFRDVVISDKVGFTYSGLDGGLAAKDFINRIHAIRDSLITGGAEGPHLVSVILDGENAWEHYDNDGKEFLHSLYQGLSDDPLIVTVTPSEFLELAPDQPTIDELWAGSWIDHNFATWIGEEEENLAWDYLVTTRDLLQEYVVGVRQTTPEVLDEARTMMYIAEGSDWFWWYGSDQDSGNDESFDQQFRDTLKEVYLILGEEPPNYLDVPIIPQASIAADSPSLGLISPEIDGVDSPGEWDAGGVYLASGGAMVAAEPFFESLTYGFDSENLYLNITNSADFSAVDGLSNVEIYLSAPGGGDINSFSRGGAFLGFKTNRLVDILLEDGVLSSANLYMATGDETWGNPELITDIAQGEDLIELAIPLEFLGNAETGDRISLRAVYNQSIDIEGTVNTVDTDLLPGTGPAELSVPDLGTTTILLEIKDPENDDHGPGTYEYPGDNVFQSGSYDILNFQVGYDDDNLVYKFNLRGPVDNPWGSPNGLSIQTFDIYIDKDGDGEGGIAMLPGRNLSLEEGYAWDYAITIEGWESGIFVPGDGGPEQIASASEFIILPDSGQMKVTIRIPKELIGDDPENWRYAAMVLSQEGYPSGGVMRVRDVSPTAEQWRIGGAPEGTTNHTRVMDIVWAEAGLQESWLSDFSPSSASQTELTSQDFATIPMLVIED